MRVTLIGADFEENLGVGMIAAAAESAGHQVAVVPFNEPSTLGWLVETVAGQAPDVVGLSIQFQHRAHEFLGLARCLRARGFAGHITCGGQFPTLAYREVLEQRENGVDSIVLHDGEETVVELLDHLQRGQSLHEVAGLALRDEAGSAVRTAARCLPQDLDALPLPKRYREPSSHLGVPFIPVMGGRGCWGACAFCSITTFYRDAKAYGGGRTLRHRSADNVAAEMAALCNHAGGRAIFCFHDDNFLLPRPEASAARVRAIREAFDAYGLGKIGIIGKCRPDSMTPALARELADLGVIRLYVGVENVSERGSAHLNRRLRTDRVHQALEACREAGIFGCYNLLLFEPDAKVADVEENLRFIRAHADQPVNFCRAEPYYGTPLQQRLADRDAIGGSYLGYDYRIADDETELLFRICAAAFRERNFAPGGVHNRYMGVGYNAKILQHFYPESAECEGLRTDAARLTRGIALETAGLLEQAIALVREIGASDAARRERIERETALLGLKIAEADRYQHAQLDELFARMVGFAARNGQPLSQPRPANAVLRVAQRMAQGVALGTLLAGWSVTAGGCSDDDAKVIDAGSRADGPSLDGDPPPPDGGVVDPLPPDGAVDPLPPDGSVVDPLPPDGSVVDPPLPDGSVVDPLPPDGSVVDPPPPDGGVVDPLPPDGAVKPDSTVVDMVPPDASAALDQPAGQQLASHWRDTAPRRAVRSEDLPLFDPPEARLFAEAAGAGAVLVRLATRPESVTTRWESDGQVEGEGLEVLWRPESDADQLRVGVRWRGGVAVVSLRAKDVLG